MGSIHGPSEYDVTIQLIHTGSGRLLGSNEITFSSDGTNSTFRAMFKEPLEIQPNTNYTAVSTLKGLDSHYGAKGHFPVQLRSWQQQWHLSGRWADSRDYFLHLSSHGQERFWRSSLFEKIMSNISLWILT